MTCTGCGDILFPSKDVPGFWECGSCGKYHAKDKSGNYFAVEKLKSSQEKSNISNKNTSYTDGFKNTQSEEDLEIEGKNECNNISMVNPHHHLNYFKMNSKSTNLENNSEQFQNNNCTFFNERKKFKINIKSSTNILNTNKIYEEEELKDINKSNL